MILAGLLLLLLLIGCSSSQAPQFSLGSSVKDKKGNKEGDLLANADFEFMGQDLWVRLRGTIE